jgi:2-oxoglutarate ferredoxin oxidoreductase subunit alpha
MRRAYKTASPSGSWETTRTRGRTLREFIKHFQRMGQVILEYNLEALGLGFHLADERGIDEEEGLYKIKKTAPEKRLLITGNESVAFGFMVAGGRFFCGYPITPSSEVLETFEMARGAGRSETDRGRARRHKYGNRAALTGTRAMVATSGPGFSLMQEGVGHCGSGKFRS